jgi:hypothetical protein
VVLGNNAVATANNQFVLGSAGFPLTTGGAIASGASVNSICVRINGVNMRIPTF